MKGTAGDVDGALGRFALSVVADGDAGGLERSLGVLRVAARADDARLYVADPVTGVLVLAGVVGRETGSYPSLLPRDGDEANPLHRDTTHLSVPLVAFDRLVGSVHVAWRRRATPPDHARKLLAGAAGVLATLAYAAWSRCVELARETAEAVVGAAPGTAALHILAVMQARLDAGGASLMLVKRAGPLGVVRTTPSAPLPCEQAFDAARCPCARTCRPVLGTSRRALPEGCPRASGEAASLYCLPVMEAGEVRGVAVVHHAPETSGPPARRLLELSALARELAAFLPTERSPAPDAGRRSLGLTPRVTVACLGRLEVRVGTEPVTWRLRGRRKALVLLKHLVLARGRPVHREVLAEMLWRDCPPEVASNRLHVLVHALRSVLEPELRPRRPLVIRHQDGCYWLDLETGWVSVDFLEMERCIRRALRQGTPRGERRLLLRSAVALYRGELFEEDALAGWCAAEREALRALLLRGVHALARLEHEDGRREDALEVLATGLRVDPLDEALHRRIIQVHLDAADRRAAVAQYNACRELLRAELGVAPSEELERLVRFPGGSAS